MSEIIDLGINIPGASYAAVMHMAKTANELGKSVKARICGKEVVVNPGDCIECAYKQVYDIPCRYHEKRSGTWGVVSE